MIGEVALVAALVAAPAPKICTDPLANTLRSAGFTGRKHRIAWSIVMRESKGQNLDESSPWYTGALGIWQVQSSAHSGKAWWSRSVMLDPRAQSRAVYLHLSAKGRDWRPWGITRNGRGMDTSHYRGWSASQHWSWIWAPYERYWKQYPKGCGR